ncbi:MAG: beta-mannosidase [Promethearchaeota archaeon]
MKKTEKLPLNGTWKLIHKEKSINIDAEVPGTVFESLINDKIIEDPFYGINEHKMGWIYDSDWQYKLIFDVKVEFLNHSKILNRFHGIDTIAEIFLNDKLLGKTDNMFTTYDFEVTDILKTTQNELKIIIKSPTKKAREQIKKHDGIQLNTGIAGIPGVPYLRKAQYSFGWDWGPKLPDIGIWKSVELIGFNEIRIKSVNPIQSFIYNKDPLEIKNPDEIPSVQIELASLEIRVELCELKVDVETLSNKYNLKVDLITPDGTSIQKEITLKSKDSQINPSIRLDIKNPQLWWTHDLGHQNLYDLTVSIKDQESNSVIDFLTQKIGIRDIRLIRNPDEWGETFYFLLNGIPLFAKGANWIPIDSFIPRGKKLGLYSMNLRYAKEANMNCIRVWGGGIYEDDIFYDLCDELGILVWQDFPFACAIYPLQIEEFAENVKQEAVQNIKRLRHHPSLALWCGNNEVEVLWIGGLMRLGLIDKDNSRNVLNKDLVTAYLDGYNKMFEEILPNLIEKYDPNHPYWPSSPSNGPGNKRGRTISNSPERGDSHFWTVWHGGASFDEFRKFDSRFMSEYGFESFPPMKTIKTFCPPDQFDFFTPIMENHQKNSAGNKKIMDYMKKRFTIPEKFEQQVILSQITHGEAMEYGIEHWRRNRNDFHCMGSLYWQLNDCWPVASWASLDYYGRWKALHYFAKRAYQSIFPSVKEEDKTVEFWVTNDERTSFSGIYQWSILNFDGKMLINGSKTVTISPCSSLKVETIAVEDINKNQSDLEKNVIFYTLKDEKHDNNIIYNGFRLFGNPKDFPLTDPELKIKVEESNKADSDDKDGLIFTLEIESKSIALYVFIDSDIVDFIASDNYFSLKPGETRKISLKIIKTHDKNKLTTETNITKSFKVKSLFDLIKN